MDARNILLVEDLQDDIYFTIRALQLHGVDNEVAVAHDGVEALEYLRATGQFRDRTPGDPLLILLDLRMPRMDGLQVLREIRSDPALRHLRVVILSSSHQNPDLVEAHRLGIEAYLIKPVQFEKFMDVVADVSLCLVPDTSHVGARLVLGEAQA